MPCSCHYQTSGAARLFSRFAGACRTRYRRLGLDRDQRRLVAALAAIGIDGATLLEIGCGVGYLHQTLLKRGALRAVGVDLSERMLEEARRLAAEQGLSERTVYHCADFTAVAPLLESADMTLLDKVICCYPSADALIASSLDKTRSIYALTYPRPHLINRLVFGFVMLAMWVLRIDFRNYLHDPRRVEQWITARGFQRCYQHVSALWLTQIYRR